jgi:hypothetical protein
MSIESLFYVMEEIWTAASNINHEPLIPDDAVIYWEA